MGYLDKTSTRGGDWGLAGAGMILGKAGGVSKKEFVGAKRVG
jgi:hypothetical protein